MSTNAMLLLLAVLFNAVWAVINFHDAWRIARRTRDLADWLEKQVAERERLQARFRQSGQRD